MTTRLVGLAGLWILCFFVQTGISSAMGEDTYTDANPTGGEFSLTVESDRALYSAGEPIILHCTFRNVGPITVKLRPFLADEPLIYIIEAGAKETLLYPKFRAFIRELIREETIITLAPEAAHTLNKPINQERYTLPASGEHGLYIIYENRIKEIGDTKLWVGRVKSNTLRIKISSKEGSRTSN